jgi:hypothetical protein
MTKSGARFLALQVSGLGRVCLMVAVVSCVLYAVPGCLQVPGLAENRPCVLRGDKLFAHVPGSNKEYEGRVQNVEREVVILAFHNDFHQAHISGAK